ncbi:glycoside hydrolase family 16 protein [Biscogniauxia marginata]|nr:glycoside hydrolase family 16 protein [Biscogniauxia marginata]
MRQHLAGWFHGAIASRWVVGSLPILLSPVWADCECGYSITTGSDNTQHVFTDLLESDFVHLDVTGDTTEYGKYGWAPQVFNVSMRAARGTYGQAFVAGDETSSNTADNNVFTGPGSKGGDAGLQLTVKSEILDNMVQSSELATTDLSYFYGTFRAGIKVTDISGTCSAFFWYQNDTQEIDIEFLSAEFNRGNSTFPVNLVLQSIASSDAGYDASGTGGFRKVNLGFDPTADFHEYRFDFLQGRVLFYADGEPLAELDGPGVPTTPGHLLLSHWSNGNPAWSRGPPSTDATTTVRYVKAYYNSSLPSRQADFAARCADPAAAGAVCAVPDNDAEFFFSYRDGMTPNQTTYGGSGDGDENGAPRRAGLGPLAETSFLWVVVGIASGIWVFGLL